MYSCTYISHVYVLHAITCDYMLFNYLHLITIFLFSEKATVTEEKNDEYVQNYQTASIFWIHLLN